MIKSNGDARCLREYSHKARTEHWCCNCFHPIFPGQAYMGEVWVMGPYLWVHKMHLECPYDPDEDYKEFLRLKEEREKALENMPQAA